MSKEKWLGSVYGFIVVIVLWYLAAVITKLPIIPSPIAVFANIAVIFASKWKSTYFSAWAGLWRA